MCMHQTKQFVYQNNTDQSLFAQIFSMLYRCRYVWINNSQRGAGEYLRHRIVPPHFHPRSAQFAERSGGSRSRRCCRLKWKRKTRDSVVVGSAAAACETVRNKRRSFIINESRVPLDKRFPTRFRSRPTPFAAAAPPPNNRTWPGYYFREEPRPTLNLLRALLRITPYTFVDPYSYFGAW